MSPGSGSGSFSSISVIVTVLTVLFPASSSLYIVYVPFSVIFTIDVDVLLPFSILSSIPLFSKYVASLSPFAILTVCICDSVSTTFIVKFTDLLSCKTFFSKLIVGAVVSGLGSGSSSSSIVVTSNVWTLLFPAKSLT